MHPESLLYICSLRNLIEHTFRHTQSDTNLNLAIGAAEAAKRDATQRGSHETQVWLALSRLLEDRCEMKENMDVDDLSYSIYCYDQVVEVLADPLTRERILSSLSKLLSYRYLRTN